MPNLIVGLVFAVMVCVGNAFGVSGVVVNANYISHSTVTCGSSYNTELAKTNVSSAYGGANYNEDYQTFVNKYCGGTANVSGSPVCYKVFHKNQNVYKMVVIADCVNSNGQNEYVELMASDFVIKYGTTNTQTSSGVGWRATFKAKCGLVTCASGQNTDWGTANSNGIQIGIVYNNTRDCNLCKKAQVATDRRCAANWYGVPSSDTSGCTRCVAENATNIIATSPAGSTTQSKCTYKCAAGYYGNATYIPSSCVSCPSGSTSSAGATTVSSCRCKSDYYGDASAGKACTACPDYATCAGGNGSTFECNTGYYNTLNAFGSNYGCQPCVENTAVCDNTGIKCKAGYYGTRKGGTAIMESCTVCPYYGQRYGIGETYGTCYYVTSAEGSMGIQSCYVIKDVCSWTDSSGNFTYGDDCYDTTE